jgi:hypothetical protein
MRNRPEVLFEGVLPSPLALLARAQPLRLFQGLYVGEVLRSAGCVLHHEQILKRDDSHLEVVELNRIGSFLPRAIRLAESVAYVMSRSLVLRP